MKVKSIIIFLILFFTTIFILKGTERTKEKMIESLKYVIPVMTISLVFWGYKKTNNSNPHKPINNNNSKQESGNIKAEFVVPDRYKYLENNNPQTPIDFGIKTVWIAIKAKNSCEVAQYIELDNQKEVNWIEGTIRAYEGDIFITPNLNGWIIIHGWGLPTPDSKFGSDETVALLNYLSGKFEEAYLFGNHRVSSVAFWGKSLKGKLKRLYVVADGTGKVIGEPNSLELKWNLIDLSENKPNPNKDEWDKLKYPGEDEVIEIAEYWSINPMEISKLENIEGKGITGRMNNRL